MCRKSSLCPNHGGTKAVICGVWEEASGDLRNEKDVVTASQETEGRILTRSAAVASPRQESSTAGEGYGLSTPIWISLWADADLDSCFPCGCRMQSSMTDEWIPDSVQQRDTRVAGGGAPFDSPLPSITREVPTAQPRASVPHAGVLGEKGGVQDTSGGSQLGGCPRSPPSGHSWGSRSPRGEAAHQTWASCPRRAPTTTGSQPRAWGHVPPGAEIPGTSPSAAVEPANPTALGGAHVSPLHSTVTDPAAQGPQTGGGARRPGDPGTGDPGATSLVSEMGPPTEAPEGGSTGSQVHSGHSGKRNPRPVVCLCHLLGNRSQSSDFHSVESLNQAERCPRTGVTRGGSGKTHGDIVPQTEKGQSLKKGTEAREVFQSDGDFRGAAVRGGSASSGM